MEGRGASREDALELALSAGLDELVFAAGRVRRAAFGRRAYCCAIASVKSGACPEDCAFCAQSARHSGQSGPGPLLSPDEVRLAARAAGEAGACGFGLVASGCGPASGEIDTYCELASAIAAEGVTAHASLGILDEGSARRLAQAGVRVYNHNLETSRSFFPKLCSSHSYDQRLATLKVLREVGIARCCGGIFGAGEGWKERVALGAELAELEVENVPLNFLHPIPGTPLGDSELLPAAEALRIICVFRLMLPVSRIQICGGRELVLRSLQPLAFAAGATGVILGDYLKTRGRSVDEDLRMLEDLGLELSA
jgi:biotin synthase